MNPYLQAILAAVIWGSGGAFIKYAHLPATSMSFFRLAVPTVLLGGYFVITQRPIKTPQTKRLLWASALGAVRLPFFYAAFLYTSISNAVVLNYVWPLFVALYQLILRRRVDRRSVMGIVVGFIGVAIALGGSFSLHQSRDLIGMVFMLAHGAIWAAALLMFDGMLKAESPLTTTFYQNVVGAVLFLPFLFINRPVPTVIQANVAIAHAVLIGVVGYLLFWGAMKQLNALTVSGLSYIEVLSGIAFGMLLFGDRLTWQIVVGGVLILGAAWYLRVNQEQLPEVSNHIDKV